MQNASEIACLGAGHDPPGAQHQPRRGLRPVRRPGRRRPAGVAHGPARLERHRDLRASCTWSPGSASRSATTGCSPTARSRRPSGSSTRSRSSAALAVQGRVDRLGRRPPQAPRAHRRGGRPAFAARRPGRRHPRRAARPLPRARRLAVQRAGPRARPTSTRATSTRTRACARIHRNFQWLVLATFAIPFGLGFALTRHAARRADRAAVGRPRARLDAAPRDVVDQQRLPLLRDAGASRSTTTRRTSSGSRCRRSASPGTTTTTRSRARRSTGCARGRSTSRRSSSARCAGSGWPGTSSRSRRSARQQLREAAAGCVGACMTSCASRSAPSARRSTRPRSSQSRGEPGAVRRAGRRRGRRRVRERAAPARPWAGGRSGFAELSRFAQTADGWIRLHGNYPHHRAALLRVLGEADPLGAARSWAAARAGGRDLRRRRLRRGGAHGRGVSGDAAGAGRRT